VLVSAVVRNLTGTPIELAEPLEVAGELSNPSSVSWIDQITIATVNTASGSTSALLSTIGGTSRQLYCSSRHQKDSCCRYQFTALPLD
jgi:hypothetical protein